MKVPLVLPACALALSLLGAACKQKPAPPPAETSAPAETSPAASSGETPRPLASSGAARSIVGVAECDEYLRKYEACIHRSSAPAANALPAFKAQRESFRIAAGTPEGKVWLVGHCRSELAKLASDKCP